jgi:hypothetical protein
MTKGTFHRAFNRNGRDVDVYIPTKAEAEAIDAAEHGEFVRKADEAVARVLRK